jgi:hypothetical protein
MSSLLHDVRKSFLDLYKKNVKYMQKQGYDITDNNEKLKYTIPRNHCESYGNSSGGGFSPCDELSILMANNYGKYEMAPCIARPIFRFMKIKGIGIPETVKFRYCPFCGFFFNSKVAY